MLATIKQARVEIQFITMLSDPQLGLSGPLLR
jgi:hypothetical protein